MNRSCFFTGHRVLKLTDDLSECLFKKIVELIESGVTDFYAGGAMGWDMLCAKTVLTLRNDFHQIKLYLILPCPPKEQTLKWNDSQKKEYQEILNSADSVEILSSFYHRDCMRIRNARLAELGDICVCYYNTENTHSGTAQTVRMAQKQGKEILNLYF